MSSLSGLPLPFSPLAFIILFKIFFILTDTQLMGRLGIKGLTILKLNEMDVYGSLGGFMEHLTGRSY